MKNTILHRAIERIEKLYKEYSLPSTQLSKIAIKPQWNVVIGSKEHAGLALNFTGEHAIYGENESLPEIESLASYLGKGLFDFAKALVDQEELHRRALCLAALNALSLPFTDSKSLISRGYRVGGAEMEDFVRPDDLVCVVGHGGVVRLFVDKGRELHVTDMRPESTFQTLILDAQGIRKGPTKIIVHPAEDNQALLEKADVAIITACTLVNGSFDETMRFASKARVRGIYGPSAALAPEALFPEGINFIRSFRATNVPRFESDMENDMDMEVAMKGNQETYHIYGFLAADR
jgi:uncharacterized protein